MNLSDTENCTVCNVPDYIEHFFYHCQRLNGFWHYVKNVILAHTDKNIQITIQHVLFGVRDEDRGMNRQVLKTINHIILIGKMCVSKLRYGKASNIFMTFDQEWNIRQRY